MAKYDYLFKEPGPKMLEVALSFLGIAEIPGRASNPIIMKWAEDFGISDIYKNDDQAWCGLAHAEVAKEAGKPVPYTSYELIRAASWVNWEEEVAIQEAMLADTLVFKRPGGNHVGLYVGETKHTFHVLGGNQSNRYGFGELSKDRCIAVRRPGYKNFPPNVRKIFVDSSGQLSNDEA